MSAAHGTPGLTRVVRVVAPPSERLRRACAAFGLSIERQGGEPAGPAPDGDALSRALRTRAGGATLLLGPSGSGKTTVLRAVAARLRARGARVQEVAKVWAELARRDEPIVDLFDEPLEESLRMLALAGMGEPMLWARRPSELSDGERARFALASAMARLARRGARGGAWLLIDELGSPLDAHTARSVCAAVARWARSTHGARAVAATVREGLEPWLEPNDVIRLELGAPPTPPAGARRAAIRRGAAGS